MIKKTHSITLTLEHCIDDKDDSKSVLNINLDGRNIVITKTNAEQTYNTIEHEIEDAEHLEWLIDDIETESTSLEGIELEEI